MSSATSSWVFLRRPNPPPASDMNLLRWRQNHPDNQLLHSSTPDIMMMQFQNSVGPDFRRSTGDLLTAQRQQPRYNTMAEAPNAGVTPKKKKKGFFSFLRKKKTSDKENRDEFSPTDSIQYLTAAENGVQPNIPVPLRLPSATMKPQAQVRPQPQTNLRRPVSMYPSTLTMQPIAEEPSSGQQPYMPSTQYKNGGIPLRSPSQSERDFDSSNRQVTKPGRHKKRQAPPPPPGKLKKAQSLDAIGLLSSGSGRTVAIIESTRPTTQANEPMRRTSESQLSETPPVSPSSSVSESRRKSQQSTRDSSEELRRKRLAPPTPPKVKPTSTKQQPYSDTSRNESDDDEHTVSADKNSVPLAFAIADNAPNKHKHEKPPPLPKTPPPRINAMKNMSSSLSLNYRDIPPTFIPPPPPSSPPPESSDSDWSPRHERRRSHPLPSGKQRNNRSGAAHYQYWKSAGHYQQLVTLRNQATSPFFPEGKDTSDHGSVSGISVGTIEDIDRTFNDAIAFGQESISRRPAADAIEKLDSEPLHVHIDDMTSAHSQDKTVSTVDSISPPSPFKTSKVSGASPGLPDSELSESGTFVYHSDISSDDSRDDIRLQGFVPATKHAPLNTVTSVNQREQVSPISNDDFPLHGNLGPPDKTAEHDKPELGLQIINGPLFVSMMPTFYEEEEHIRWKAVKIESSEICEKPLIYTAVSPDSEAANTPRHRITSNIELKSEAVLLHDVIPETNIDESTGDILQCEIKKPSRIDAKLSPRDDLISDKENLRQVAKKGKVEKPVEVGKLSPIRQKERRKIPVVTADKFFYGYNSVEGKLDSDSHVFNKPELSVVKSAQSNIPAVSVPQQINKTHSPTVRQENRETQPVPERQAAKPKVTVIKFETDGHVEIGHKTVAAIDKALSRQSEPATVETVAESAPSKLRDEILSSSRHPSAVASEENAGPVVEVIEDVIVPSVKDSDKSANIVEQSGSSSFLSSTEGQNKEVREELIIPSVSPKRTVNSADSEEPELFRKPPETISNQPKYVSVKTQGNAIQEYDSGAKQVSVDSQHPLHPSASISGPRPFRKVSFDTAEISAHVHSKPHSARAKSLVPFQSPTLISTSNQTSDLQSQSSLPPPITIVNLHSSTMQQRDIQRPSQSRHHQTKNQPKSPPRNRPDWVDKAQSLTDIYRRNYGQAQVKVHNHHNTPHTGKERILKVKPLIVRDPQDDFKVQSMLNLSRHPHSTAITGKNSTALDNTQNLRSPQKLKEVMAYPSGAQSMIDITKKSSSNQKLLNSSHATPDNRESEDILKDIFNEAQRRRRKYDTGSFSWAAKDIDHSSDVVRSAPRQLKHDAILSRLHSEHAAELNSSSRTSLLSDIKKFSKRDQLKNTGNFEFQLGDDEAGNNYIAQSMPNLSNFAPHIQDMRLQAHQSGKSRYGVHNKPPLQRRHSPGYGHSNPASNGPFVSTAPDFSKVLSEIRKRRTDFSPEAQRKPFVRDPSVTTSANQVIQRVDFDDHQTHSDSQIAAQLQAYHMWRDQLATNQRLLNQLEPGSQEYTLQLQQIDIQRNLLQQLRKSLKLEGHDC